MADSPHIVHVSFFVDPSGRSPRELLGAWPTLTEVAAGVARLGFRVSVVHASQIDETIEDGGVSYFFVADRTVEQGFSGKLARLRRRPRLEAKVASCAPDLVHVHGLNSPFQTRFLVESLPDAPVLAQDHASLAPAGWRRAPYRWGFRGLAGVAFTAREQAEPFFTAGVFSRDLPVFEVTEGSTLFTPGDAGEARERTGLYGDPCLLWVGRLDENKDPLTILNAFSRVLGRLPDPHLWCFYTEAPLETAVRDRIQAEPELSNRVHLLGTVPHERMEVIYRASDFLLSGSHHEGSGYAVIEALACGTTPLVTKIPSFRRITGDGAAGGLWPPGDSGALAWNLLKWAKRDRSALRKAARAQFEKSLSYPAIASQLRAAYEELLKVK